MGSHPINLAVRFGLELVALGAFAWLGWQQASSRWAQVALALILPLVAAALWAAFAVPDDPSRSGAAPIPTPGPVRLALELAFFAAAAWVLQTRTSGLAWGFIAIVAVHYLASYDRVRWLLGLD